MIRHRNTNNYKQLEMRTQQQSSMIPVRKKHVLLMLFLGLSFIVVAYYTLIVRVTNTVQPRQHGVKYILYWTKMFEREDFYLGTGSEPFQNCPVSNCFATTNKKLMPVEKFDAIMFHGPEYNPRRFGKPEKRSPNQVYIYSNMESPCHTPSFQISENFYNWTMTYRADSDIMRNYGFYEKFENNKRNHYKLPTIEDIQMKNRSIAWMVSHCKVCSKREELAKKINDLIPVDIYGYCGKFVCPRKTEKYCFEMLEKYYKFYLSFENSYCKEYVTEKLWSILKKNIVPLVYSNVNYEEIAPPHSVIDVTKFQTVQNLTNYLQFLDENIDEYLKFFEWKKHYYIFDRIRLKVVCQLCDKLNRPLEHKSMHNINEWWFNKNVCKKGNDLPQIIFS